MDLASPAPVPAAPDLVRVQRRTLRVLGATQLLGGVGLASGVAVGALLAEDLLGPRSLAGLPAAASTTGGALAALPISRLMTRAGRRPGLAAGYGTGGTGAVLVVVSAALGSGPLLLLGMLLFGVGNTSSLLARYAAADLAAPDRRGRALSTVLFATTFGAVTGPTLVEPAGAVADAVALPRLAGPFVLSVLAYALAALLVWALLRPDPLLLARGDVATAPAPRREAWGALLHGSALLGLTAMVGAQFVMVAMMTMTPVHMREHDHSLGLIGLVISAHIAGMFAFAPVGGLLVDRLGAGSTVRLGAVTLLAAGATGALAPEESAAVLGLALFLLGLGWSFSLVGGSALVTAGVPLPLRAGAQGSGDLLVGLAGASGGLGSGLVLSLSGFTALGVLTVAVAVLLLRPPPRAPAEPA